MARCPRRASWASSGRSSLAATDDDGVGQADEIHGLEGADADERADDW
jgi:hypothetical protein